MCHRMDSTCTRPCTGATSTGPPTLARRGHAMSPLDHIRTGTEGEGAVSDGLAVEGGWGGGPGGVRRIVVRLLG